MDILVIGSSLIDLFLRVKNPKHYTIDASSHLTFTLGDKIPTDIEKLTLGGNASNVSVGLKRLGFKSALYTFLGTDILSREIEETVKKEGVELFTESNRAENTSLSLIFNFQTDRIIFSHHEVREHSFDYETPVPTFIYLTSIGDEWEKTYKQVFAFVTKHSIPLAFSPGSNQMDNINDLFLEMLRKTSLLFVNREEAEKILSASRKSHATIEEIARNMKDLGPQRISITEGANGAYAYDTDNVLYKGRSFDGNRDIIERTGAGDAYAVGFLGSHLLGNDIQTALAWGAANSYSVMKHVGAQEGLLTRDAVTNLLRSHPEYHIQKL